MNDREAFKFGFILKCANDGLTLEQTLARARAALCKHAQAPSPAWLGSLASGAMELGGKLGRGAVNLGHLLLSALGQYKLLVLPMSILAGGFGGYAISKAIDDAYDEAEAMKREELATIYDEITKLRRERERWNEMAHTT